MSKPQFTIIDDSVLADAPQTTTNSLLVSSPDKIREAVAELFDSFILTKTHQHQTFGIYKAAVDSMSGHDQKFLVAIVPNDVRVPVGSSVYLKGLPWLSFQTRSTDNPNVEFAGFRLKPQPYKALIRKGSILYDKIKIGAELPDKHIYVPDHLPLSVEILLKRPEEYFAQEAYVVSAINMFRTSIILEQQHS